MKQSQKESNHIRPVINNQAANDSCNSVRNNAKPESFSFRYFRAMLLGGVIGSLLGTIIVKIITQFL